jgi:hypothetical protein
MNPETLHRCPTCDAPAHFVAFFGAPGRGSAWRCDNGHELARIGSTFVDQAQVPTDAGPPWVANPESER